MSGKDVTLHLQVRLTYTGKCKSMGGEKLVERSRIYMVRILGDAHVS